MKKIEIEMEFETKFKGAPLTVVCSVTNPVSSSLAFSHEFGTEDPGMELEQVDFEKVHVWSQRRNKYVKVSSELEQTLTEKIWDENFLRIETAVSEAGVEYQ